MRLNIKGRGTSESCRCPIGLRGDSRSRTAAARGAPKAQQQLRCMPSAAPSHGAAVRCQVCAERTQAPLSNGLPHNARMKSSSCLPVSFVVSFMHTPFCSEEEDVAVVLLVPVRAAMHGSFPLAGTYFQARLLPGSLHCHISIVQHPDACHICNVHVKYLDMHMPCRSTRCSWHMTQWHGRCRYGGLLQLLSTIYRLLLALRCGSADLPRHMTGAKGNARRCSAGCALWHAHRRHLPWDEPGAGARLPLVAIKSAPQRASGADCD